jgi:Trk K+ transport system NAD-binding subunit
VAAVVREDTVNMPGPDLTVQQGDRIIVFAERGQIAEVERLFRVSAEYF